MILWTMSLCDIMLCADNTSGCSLLDALFSIFDTSGMVCTPEKRIGFHFLEITIDSGNYLLLLI